MPDFDVPPEEIYVGKVRGEWPLRAFASVSQARSWAAVDPYRRTVWLATVRKYRRMRYVPPGDSRLEPIE